MRDEWVLPRSLVFITHVYTPPQTPTGTSQRCSSLRERGFGKRTDSAAKKGQTTYKSVTYLPRNVAAVSRAMNWIEHKKHDIAESHALAKGFAAKDEQDKLRRDALLNDSADAVALARQHIQYIMEVSRSAYSICSFDVTMCCTLT
jgi:hypothetical protein